MPNTMQRLGIKAAARVCGYNRRLPGDQHVARMETVDLVEAVRQGIVRSERCREPVRRFASRPWLHPDDAAEHIRRLESPIGDGGLDESLVGVAAAVSYLAPRITIRRRSPSDMDHQSGPGPGDVRTGRPLDRCGGTGGIELYRLADVALDIPRNATQSVRSLAVPQGPHLADGLVADAVTIRRCRAAA